MVELIFISFVIATVLFKIWHPHIKWRCMIGIHRYGRSHERHGMYYDKTTDLIVGTQRIVYTCSCGKEKPAENKDWI